MNKIRNYLRKIGLSDLEIKLYQGLLEMGPTTVMELSTHTGIKRITAHFNIENLIRKGLVTQTRKGARRQIIAEPPDRLNHLVDQQVEQAQSLQSQLPEIIKAMENVTPKNEHNKEVSIKYYEGKESIFLLYQETMQSNLFYSFADYDRYYEIYPDTIDTWNAAYKEHPKREVWDLVVDSPLSRSIAKATHRHHHIKFLPRADFFAGFEFSDAIIYGDNVAMIQLDPQNILATVIKSRQIALSLIALHRSMWNLLPDEPPRT